MKKRLFLVMLLLSKTVFATLSTLPENHAVNGGVTLIPIDMQQKPQVSYDDKRVMVLPSGKRNQWLMIVGIPLDKPAGIEELTLKSPQMGSIPFHISKKIYPSQFLTIVDTSKVDLNPNDEKRVNTETREMNVLFSQYSNQDPFAKPFIAPVHAPISSLFGLQRFYNKKPRTPHSGLDIAATENTPVLAIGDGKVVSVKDYFFTGNTVIIDHGMGLFSLYGHLKKTNVVPGQVIKQGTNIGLVGKTGRATGPHLHWSMILNQTLVDPLLFIPASSINTVPKPSGKKHA